MEGPVQSKPFVIIYVSLCIKSDDLIYSEDILQEYHFCTTALCLRLYFQKVRVTSISDGQGHKILR